METRRWSAVPCTIVRSDVLPLRLSPVTPPEWRVFLAYDYQWKGRTLRSTRWRRVAFLESDDAEVSRKSSHREVAEALAARYPVGLATTCHVNPAAPDEAVLEHLTKAPLYTLWWPLIFAAGGAGILRSALRSRSTS